MLNKEVIENILNNAKSVDKDLEVFGAGKHKYQLNPVTTLEKVHEFEKKYGLTLPEAYVTFLTEIGNGGAGPDYGLYSLEQVEVWNRDWLHQNTEKQPFIDEKMTAAKWKLVMDETDELEDDEKYEEIMSDIYTGILVIGTKGCTYDNILMCKGSERGKIVYFDWNLEGECPPYLTGMNFEDWYMNYFKEIAAGYNVHQYGYYYLGNEEELMNQYKNSDLIEQKKKCVTSFSRLKKLSPNTIDFLINIKEKEMNDIRLWLLLKYSSEHGIILFEKFLAGEDEMAAVERAGMLPKEKKDKFYQPMLRLLYQENKVDKLSILFFLKDCSGSCAGDVLPYAINTDNPEDVRKTAVYVMGKCPDAEEYIDEFIMLMKDKSYWVAHAALQATISAGLDSTELTACYRWMAQQYADDSTMQNNLALVID